jgi:hypothetical protein
MKKYVNVLQERNYSAAVPIDIKDRAVVDFLIRIVSWGFSIKMDAWIAAAIIAKKIKKLKADIKCHCVNRFLVSKVFDLSLTGLYGNCFDYQYRYAVNVEWTEKHSEQNFINISTGE